MCVCVFFFRRVLKHLQKQVAKSSCLPNVFKNPWVPFARIIPLVFLKLTKCHAVTMSDPHGTGWTNKDSPYGGIGSVFQLFWSKDIT